MTATERKHALLSASGAHRWLNCTASPRLEETFPDNQSEHAALGTLAHEVGELKLQKWLTLMKPSTYTSRLKKLKNSPLWEDAIMGHTDTYIDYIKSIVHQFPSNPYVAIEKRLNFSAWVPEGFGTGDCIIIGNETLYVIDFKYGKGVPVSAERNEQLLLYALGAYTEYSFLYSIRNVVLVVVQPRLDSISEYGLTTKELLDWGENVKPVARKAFEGNGEFKAGDWCRFCRAKSQCRARATDLISLESYGFAKPPLLSNEEIGQILLKAKDLAKWAKDIEEWALGECLAGGEVPGWKVVAGRTSRGYTDMDAAFENLKTQGVREELLFERKPLTVPALEKVLGKELYENWSADFVKIEPGKPTLVQENDKREALKPNLEGIFKPI